MRKNQIKRAVTMHVNDPIIEATGPISKSSRGGMVEVR